MTEVLLLRCYANWHDSKLLTQKASEDARYGVIHNLLKDGAGRILKCPSTIFGCQHMLVSFKDYSTVTYDVLKAGIKDKSWEKIATIATPFAESLQQQFMANASRIGTPDASTRDEEKEWAKEFVRET